MATINWRDTSNSSILKAYYKDNPGLGFDQRTSLAQKSELARQFNHMTEYTPRMNAFIGWFLNRIGRVIFTEKKAFTNPLAEFKSEDLKFGSTVQEISTGLLMAHQYDPKSDGETVFSREVPEAKALYHELNRQEYYKISIQRDQLRAAFLNDGDLGRLIDDLMSTLVTSDNIDEFNYMLNLFKLYHEKLGGFFLQKAGMSTITNDGDRAKDLLKSIKVAGIDMSYPNVRYNAGNMPVWAGKDELIVFTTPRRAAEIDVDALAAAFNIDRMTIDQRIIVIPTHSWPLKDVHTILTTSYFFKVFDVLTEVGEITNPQSMITNSFLHRWQIISASAFAPSIGFTDDLETIVVESEPVAITAGDVTVVSIYPRNAGESLANVTRGGELALDAALTVSDVSKPISTTVAWEVRGNTSARTTISKDGTLTVAGDERSNSLTVRVYMLDDQGELVAGATVPGAEETIPVVGPIIPVIANRNPDGDIHGSDPVQSLDVNDDVPLDKIVG